MRETTLRNKYKNRSSAERGGTLIEFTVVASAFFMMLVGIVAAGNLYYTHNALVEATRRGARYAVLNSTGSTTAVKNVTVYGTPTPAVGATSLIYNLQPSNVDVVYSALNVAQGTVTVTISNYSFPFVLPTRTTSITMPPYRTTVTGECAGFLPPDI
ncbi:MAG: TadE/TadG family type IV pilus assembly protein [Pyrinomonadaceae bacterium]